MDEKEWLSYHKEKTKDDRDFFSNKGKAERERWVVSEFLKNLSVVFNESELISPEQTSKTDVIFRSARFQVKEICNPGTRLTAYTREMFKGAEQACTIADLKFPTIGEDIPPVAKFYDLVVDEAKKKSQSKQYIDIKNEIDLIFYVTRTRASLIKPDEILQKDFSDLGWRSVCCLSGNQAIVLFHTPESPICLNK